MAFGIDHLRREMHASFAAQGAILAKLQELILNMPTDQELNTALDGFSQAIGQAVTDAQTRTQTDIDALKAQIAAGTPVTQADLDKIAQMQAQALSGIASIDPANPTPPTP